MADDDSPQEKLAQEILSGGPIVAEARQALGKMFQTTFAVLTEDIETRIKSYMICFLVLEALMIGVFCALDLVLFYVFFEGGLIPMFLIIGIWGGSNRIYATLSSSSTRCSARC